MGCSCHDNDPLIPKVAVIKEMREDTHDVITFKIIDKDGNRPFDFLPGQCAMLSIPMIGEAIFSITSSPTEKEYIECSIKRCGKVTDYLHELEVGDEIGVRGPYGNNFPVEKIKQTDLLFIAGGIGLAPLRSVINYAMDNRSDYGLIDIVYGARTPNDLVHPKDIFEIWPKKLNTRVHLTVDIEHPDWSGAVGYVPTFVEALAFDINKTVLICGPPIMIKYTLQVLEEIGFKKEQIYTTLELKMKCGIGKCGRCNIGDKYVCKDGPVFRCDEITELPNEY